METQTEVTIGARYVQILLSRESRDLTYISFGFHCSFKKAFTKSEVLHIMQNDE